MKLSAEEFQLLSSIKESLVAMSGRNGSRSIGDTESRTGLNVSSISISTADTTFTSLVCEGNGATLDDEYFLGGLAAATLGSLWTAPEGYRFTAIQLASGSIDITGPNITGTVEE